MDDQTVDESNPPEQGREEEMRAALGTGIDSSGAKQVGGNAVAIVGIIAAAAVLLVCILACALLAYAIIVST